MNKNYNILICPLEWGLGHAARMIPLAVTLQKMQCNIIIGSGEEHLSLFRKEVPGLSYVSFPGFKPGYSRFIPQYLFLLMKTPLLLYHIIREHFRLKKIIRDNAVDIVISDNRFGLWNRKVKTVYVTHLPLIPLPDALRFLEFIGVFIHRQIIKLYSFCFIPDLPGDLNISGRLSHGLKLPENVRYIGILSKFTTTGADTQENTNIFPHNTVILSGPEPQRGILKHKLAKILNEMDPPTVILEGKPDTEQTINRSGNIIYYSHLPSPEMKMMISGSNAVISRSGYTTIMELISLNCPALLIPTPGQTEQEYLAKYLSEKGWFSTITQRRLKEGISFTSSITQWTSEIVEQSKVLMADALKELLEKPHKGCQSE